MLQDRAPGLTNPFQLTAIEAAEKVAKGEISSEDLVSSCLERIESQEDLIGAWAHLDKDYALEQARKADEHLQAGLGVGPLHGVPVGVKDIFDTQDMPTEYGTSIHAGHQPKEDAAAVSALRSAGAVILGKTVTAELAFFSPGKTGNPQNPEHTPGGSSSGSAAAVAAHMVPFAVGTQTAGSIIRPAAYCGIVGFKPSYGLISRTNVLPQSPPLDTVGTFARTVEDVALITDCLTSYDKGDSAMWPRSRPNLLAIARDEPPVTPMLAFVKSPVWDQAESVTQEAFGELAEFLGEQCDEVELPEIFNKAIGWQRLIQIADIAKYYGPLADKAPDEVSAILKRTIEEGRTVSAVDYNIARDFQSVVSAGLDQIFERYDAIITPSAPGPAPKGLETTGPPTFNGLWTYAGVPAINLPVLEAEGLPMGVQLVGPKRDDGRLLRTARWLAHHVENAGEQA